MVFASAECLETVLPQFAKKVFGESSSVTEKQLFGGALLLSFVFEGSEFHGAGVISYLGKPIVVRRGIAKEYGVFRQGGLDGISQCLGDEGLPVVVVNLDVVVFLEQGKILLKKLRDVPFDNQLRCGNVFARAEQLRLFVRDGLVFEGEVLQEHAERGEEPLPFLHVHVPVLVVSIEERRRMHGMIWKLSLPERFSIAAFVGVDVESLVVEQQGDEIVLGFRPDVAGFVDEDGEICHRTEYLQYKKCRGETPGCRKPSVNGRPVSLYHIPRSRASSLYSKQVFYNSRCLTEKAT